MCTSTRSRNRQNPASRRRSFLQVKWRWSLKSFSLSLLGIFSGISLAIVIIDWSAPRRKLRILMLRHDLIPVIIWSYISLERIAPPGASLAQDSPISGGEATILLSIKPFRWCLAFAPVETAELIFWLGAKAASAYLQPWKWHLFEQVQVCEPLLDMLHIRTMLRQTKIWHCVQLEISRPLYVSSSV